MGPRTDQTHKLRKPGKKVWIMQCRGQPPSGREKSLGDDEQIWRGGKVLHINVYVAPAKDNLATAVSEELTCQQEALIFRVTSKPLGGKLTTLDFLHPGKSSSLPTPHKDG